VKERQRIVALHLYVRRAQQQEEDAAEAAKVALGRAALAQHQPSMESFAPALPRPAFLMPNFHQLHAHASSSAAVDAAYLKADGKNIKVPPFLN